MMGMPLLLQNRQPSSQSLLGRYARTLPHSLSDTRHFLTQYTTAPAVPLDIQSCSEAISTFHRVCCVVSDRSQLLAIERHVGRFSLVVVSRPWFTATQQRPRIPLRPSHLLKSHVDQHELFLLTHGYLVEGRCSHSIQVSSTRARSPQRRVSRSMSTDIAALGSGILEQHRRRVMVFLHGIMGNSKSWMPIAQRLAEALPLWRFLLVDLRNHGASSLLVCRCDATHSLTERVATRGSHRAR